MVIGNTNKTVYSSYQGGKNDNSTEKTLLLMSQDETRGANKSRKNLERPINQHLVLSAILL